MESVERDLHQRLGWLEWAHPHEWSRHPKRETFQRLSEFEGLAVFTYVGFSAAPESIRKHAKEYVIHSVTRLGKRASHPLHGLFLSTTSPELEAAIAASRAILDLEVSPEEGVDKPYSLETWRRTVSVLRKLAELYWELEGHHLAAPSIGPAVSGSIDLFWELDDLTLLVNVPSDPGKGVTFFGRRQSGSKISGVIGPSDVEPRHLAAWLARGDLR